MHETVEIEEKQLAENMPSCCGRFRTRRGAIQRTFLVRSYTENSLRKYIYLCRVECLGFRVQGLQLFEEIYIPGAPPCPVSSAGRAHRTGNTPS